MKIGTLRHRIDIEAFVIGMDSNGIQTEEWDTTRTSDEPDLIPADIVPLSGREFVNAQAIQAGITTRITVRWRAGVTAGMRVVHGSDVYNIKGVLPDPTLRRHLTLMCETGVIIEGAA